MPARQRETTLTQAIYRHHPRFAGTPLLYEPDLEHVEGGDVLLLAPGVIAVGVGERTTPAGAERLARRAFAAGLAHTVLVVPVAQQRATMHLDTVCTMVDVDAVVMYPKLADAMVAYPVTDAAAASRWSARPSRSSTRRRRRWASTPCGSSIPGWTRLPPSGSSGTTGTTRSPSPRGSAWRTSGTWRPTCSWNGPVSR